MRILTAIFIMLSCLGLLTSCGFHLQHGTHLAQPLHRLKLQTPDPYGVLTRSLQQYLALSHIKIMAEPSQADTILSILSDNNYQDLISVSSTQQTRQYNLRVVVTFQVTDQSGNIIIPAQTLTEARIITVQSNQILGSSNEANLYYIQMRRAVALSILNRLASQEVSNAINNAFVNKSKSKQLEKQKQK